MTLKVSNPTFDAEQITFISRKFNNFVSTVTAKNIFGQKALELIFFYPYERAVNKTARIFSYFIICRANKEQLNNEIML